MGCVKLSVVITFCMSNIGNPEETNGGASIVDWVFMYKGEYSGIFHIVILLVYVSQTFFILIIHPQNTG